MGDLGGAPGTGALAAAAVRFLAAGLGEAGFSGGKSEGAVAERGMG
jgi:hypothetical protein